MRYLSQLIWLLLLPVQLWAQSPHGDNFNIKCEVCHSPEGWQLVEHSKFDHDTTGFALKGTHESVACRQCHVSLVFSQAPTNCNACHNDIHENTVGQDCDECHNTTTWGRNRHHGNTPAKPVPVNRSAHHGRLLRLPQINIAHAI